MPIDQPTDLLAEVQGVREHVMAQGSEILKRWQPLLNRSAFIPGAANLAYYLALRDLDLRQLQRRLITWGLSGLGRSESRVLPTLDAVIANLRLLAGENSGAIHRPTPEDYFSGERELALNTDVLFGPAIEGRTTRIMVTMGAKMAKDRTQIRDLFKAGMDAVRINTAHDGISGWKQIIKAVRAEGDAFGRRCPILMDLQGPKIRTRDVITPKERKTVRPGDRILLAFDAPEENERFSFQASCAMPDVLRQVKAGAKVSIKDGLIVGVVEEVDAAGLVVAVTRTPPEGQALEPEKGINFPATPIEVMPLTLEDLRDLDFVAVNADMVGYSFVQRPEDVALLQTELTKRRDGRPPIGIVAKIETQLGFSNLPEIIVQGAGGNPFAVMIARGDLAVEIGYERMSEVQEEILWLCEAAYVPVIWATQVLESLVKRGMPSRGEFTDAAMGNRAECVMLNKGKFIAEGVSVLDNVLRRMEAHMVKKSPQLRALSAWAGRA
jgi:pyruvate kinase